MAAVSNTISISRLLLSSSPSPTDITRALAYAQFPFAGHALTQTRVVSNRYITVSLQTSNKCASYLTIKKGYIVHLSRTEVEMVNVPLNFSDTSYCTLSCIYWRSLCILKCYYRYKVKWPRLRVTHEPVAFALTEPHWQESLPVAFAPTEPRWQESL